MLKKQTDSTLKKILFELESLSPLEAPLQKKVDSLRAQVAVGLGSKDFTGKDRQAL